MQHSIAQQCKSMHQQKKLIACSERIPEGIIVHALCYMCRPTNEPADLATMQAKVDGTVGWPVLPDITLQVRTYNFLMPLTLLVDSTAEQEPMLSLYGTSGCMFIASYTNACSYNSTLCMNDALLSSAGPLIETPYTHAAALHMSLTY
jgi:hypothetical protein